MSTKILFPLLLLTTATFHHSASAQADFTKDVENGPGTFENVVPDGWFKNDETGDAADTGNILFMTDGHWESYRRDTERFIAFFHASDCKWCTFSKPGFVGASRKFRRSMPFLAVDCKGAGAGTCSKLGILSHPRLQYFQRGVDEPEDPKFFEDGAKDSGQFVTFVEKKLDEAERASFGIVGDNNIDITKLKQIDTSKLKKLRVKQLRKMLKERGQRCVGCTDKNEYVQRVKDTLHLPILTAKEQKDGLASGKTKKTKRKSLMQEKRERALRKLAKKGWSNEEYGNGNIVHSHDGHFEELYLTKQKDLDGGALVYFHAPWCHHCHTYKPILVELSVDLEQSNSIHEIVAIDLDGSQELKNKYKIKSFPTFIFFRNGEEDMTFYEEEGSPRSKKDLWKFFQRLDNYDYMNEPEGKFVNKWQWGKEEVKIEQDNGNVLFMESDHWKSWRESGEGDDGFMVIFYTDWCSHCKDVKPHYAQTSRLVKENPVTENVKLLAMNCDTFGRDICRRDYKISSFPNMLFFYPKKSREINLRLEEYEIYEGPRDRILVAEAIAERCDPSYV